MPFMSTPFLDDTNFWLDQKYPIATEISYLGLFLGFNPLPIFPSLAASPSAKVIHLIRPFDSHKTLDRLRKEIVSWRARCASSLRTSEPRARVTLPSDVQLAKTTRNARKQLFGSQVKD